MKKNDARLFFKLFAVVLMFSGVLGFAHGQSYGRLEETQSNMASYYYFVQPGSPTVRVSVMGPVRYPGVYEVAKGSRLLDVLALCGGPDPGRVEFVNKQRTTLRLFRPQASDKDPFYESLLENTLAGQTESPELLEGDVLVIDVAAWRRFDWRDVLTIVNVVNTVVIIFLAVSNLDAGD
jgi:hypothetical protein